MEEAKKKYWRREHGIIDPVVAIIKCTWKGAPRLHRHFSYVVLPNMLLVSLNRLKEQSYDRVVRRGRTLVKQKRHMFASQLRERERETVCVLISGACCYLFVLPRLVSPPGPSELLDMRNVCCVGGSEGHLLFRVLRDSRRWGNSTSSAVCGHAKTSLWRCTFISVRHGFSTISNRDHHETMVRPEREQLDATGLFSFSSYARQRDVRNTSNLTSRKIALFLSLFPFFLNIYIRSQQSSSSEFAPGNRAPFLLIYFYLSSFLPLWRYIPSKKA